jgi:hypothetical protein
MKNKLLEAALAYAEQGWPVFPCQPNGRVTAKGTADKSPLTTNGVLDATTDPDRIREYWREHPHANIGFNVGAAGLLALDFDPGSSDAEVATALGKYDRTNLVAKTPRGGRHEFFALNSGEYVAPDSSGKIAPHVDVRSFNSYVLLAPSETIDGPYFWEKRGEPAFRPDSVIRLVNAAREKSKDRDNWLIEPDLPAHVARAIKWLKHDAKIAVEGQGGDHTAYATAAMMKSMGISEGKAFELMLEYWNPRNSPPWGEHEYDHLEAKINNGYSYNTSPPGNMTDAYHRALTRSQFSPIVNSRPEGTDGNAVTSGRFRFLDRAGMAAIKPPSWIIPGFLPERSSVIIFGAPEAFKTFITLDAFLTVATGIKHPAFTQWPGQWGEVSATGPVLFAAGEGFSGLQNRVTAWEKQYNDGEPVANFNVVAPLPNVLEDPEEFIAGARALSPEGYKLIGLDTVSKSMRGADENSAKDAGLYDQLARALIEEFDCTVVGIAHSGHDKKERQRGSNAFEGDADTVVMADRSGDDYAVTLRMTKQKEAAHWSVSPVFRLQELELSAETKSLVAMKAELPSRDVKPAGEKKPTVAAEAFVKNSLDAAVNAVLASNKVRNWTTKELAEAVAMREEINIDSKTLRNRHLIALREDSGTKASKYFDPAKPARNGQWQWRA